MNHGTITTIAFSIALDSLQFVFKFKLNFYVKQLVSRSMIIKILFE